MLQPRYHWKNLEQYLAASFCLGALACTAKIPDSIAPGSGPDATNVPNPMGSNGSPSTNTGSTVPPAQVPGGPASPSTCSGAPLPPKVPLRRITSAQYTNAVSDLFHGKITASPQFPVVNGGVSVSGFSTDPESNTVTQLAAEQILHAAEDTAVDVAAKLPELLPCSVTAPDAACADQFLNEYARRAFRRPPTNAEHTALRAVFDKFKGDGFDVGIAATTVALLQLPQFLYLVEIGPSDAPSGAIALTPFEQATRLAFLLWETLPDDELLQAAEQGKLTTPAELKTQAQRLLASPRAEQASVRFFREWTHFRTFTPAERAAAFPDFTDALATAIQQQFDRFVLDNTFKPGGSLDLLFTDSAFPVNASLAKFYGLTAPVTPVTDAFSTTTLSRDHAGGLLALPALLGGLSHEKDTSVIFRGKFGLTKLLCTDLPSPPAGAVSLAPVLPADATARERSLGIRANPTCAACHNLIDNVGLGLEDFDAIGQHRTLDRLGRPVDSQGMLPDGTTFNGVAELGATLATNPTVRECVAKQWFRFTFSRRESADDNCTVAALKQPLNLPGGSIKDLMLAAITSPAFGSRNVGTEGGTP